MSDRSPLRPAPADDPDARPAKGRAKTPSHVRTVSRVWWMVGAIIVGLVLAFIVWDARGRIGYLASLTPAPNPPPSSQVTAYLTAGDTHARHRVMLPVGANDTMHWILQTQDSLGRGAFRLRMVSYDNAPDGREVHWASPLRWWLGALAWVDHHVSGVSWSVGVERAALYGGPVLLAGALLLLVPLVARTCSGAAAVVVAVAAVGASPLYLDFLPGRADHHGLAQGCALLAVLFLWRAVVPSVHHVAGSPAERRATLRWTHAAAGAGAVGLWISASTVAPVLVMLGMGGGVAALVGGRRADLVWQRHPELWRHWGGVGAVVSLLAYGWEYFPQHLALRLEVNHPLYALAWAGGGELLRILCAATATGEATWRRERVRAGCAFVALLLLPLTLFLGGASAFAVADDFLWRLHAQHIAEFQTLWQHLFTPDFRWDRVEVLLPLLLLLPSLVGLFARGATRAERAPWVLVLVPAVGAWVMGFYQVRWLGLACALSLPAAVAWLHPRRGRYAALGWATAAIVVLLPGVWAAVERSVGSRVFTESTLEHLMERDVARTLRQRQGERPLVVLAPPGSTTPLLYFGADAGIGTLYWENAAGVEKAGRFYAAATAAEAEALVRAWGVTHLVHLAWDAFEDELAKLYREKEPLAAAPETFFTQLLRSPVPPGWLKPIAFTRPVPPGWGDLPVRIWEVVPPMNREQALVSAGTFFLESGRLEDAARFLPMLRGAAQQDLAAAVLWARIAQAHGEAAVWSEAMQRVWDQRAAASRLPLADRLQLAELLRVAERTAEARNELARALAQADETALRAVGALGIQRLLGLVEELEVEWPSDELRVLAQRLAGSE